MFEAFQQHPREVGETYAEHLGQASSFGITLLAAGGACLVHAVFPFWFEQTASRRIKLLHARMSNRHASEQVTEQLAA